ncbi:MAG: Gldg family protein, partial [Anaerolineae bacterium]|nr:Gldg family protein [Anaerolineae bacterium]
FRAIGAGSRFESIERGVVDVRDLLYYLSLTVLFLMLNVVSLDSKRWSEGDNTQSYRQRLLLTAGLIGLNLIALNAWLFPLNGFRLDLTEQREYSLSPATVDLMSNLQEPLLIRGYFSERTHPLLAPLVPRIRDTLAEYEIASDGKVTIEIVDPVQNPDLEAEANQTYGIRPTPLQAADRYGASLVNAYFDVLVRYGDQSEVLNFQDLIEIQQFRSGDVDVRLRNLEYDLTRAIKKTVFGFQSIDSVLASFEEPINLTLYVTPATLPEAWQDAPVTIEQVAADIAARSNGKFSFEIVDVDDPNSPVTRQTMQEQFGLQPVLVSLFSNETYYLHMVLQIGQEAQLLFPSGELSEANIRTAIESALKRNSTGFLKVVGVWTPPDTPTPNAFGQPGPSLKRYNTIRDQLRQEYTVRNVNLGTGQVPSDIDTVVVVAPQNMTELERFAIDQYLMRGGAVIIAAGNYGLALDQFGGGLGVEPLSGGLNDILDHYGISVGQSMVMDPQNEPFPTQVTRNLGGVQVQEIQAIDYPPFVDVRPDGMDQNSPILASLQAVTLNWVSPLTIDEAKNEGRQVTRLLSSTPNSWLRTDTNIQPDFALHPELGFQVEGQPQSYLLAAAVQGQFDSFYAGQPSPIAEAANSETPPVDPNTGAPLELIDVGVIDSSPQSARLVVIGSAEFLNDIVFEISGSLSFDRFQNSLQLLQNSVDWAVEDLDLLTIRARGTASRVLLPMSDQAQSFWEFANYALALLALVGLGWVWRIRQRAEAPYELAPAKAGN